MIGPELRACGSRCHISFSQRDAAHMLVLSGHCRATPCRPVPWQACPAAMAALQCTQLKTHTALHHWCIAHSRGGAAGAEGAQLPPAPAGNEPHTRDSVGLGPGVAMIGVDCIEQCVRTPQQPGGHKHGRVAGSTLLCIPPSGRAGVAATACALHPFSPAWKTALRRPVAAVHFHPLTAPHQPPTITILAAHSSPHQQP